MSPFKPKPKPTPPAVQEPFLSQKSPTFVQSDSRTANIAALLPYVAGYAMRVRYYRNLLTEASETISTQITSDFVFQEYQRIDNFELKVTSPFSPSFDTEKGESVLEGEAQVYTGFRPNRGDVFLADAGQGREFVITVETSELRNVFEGSVSVITYRVAEWASNPEWIAALEERVVKRTTYVRDALLYGNDPLFLEQDYSYWQFFQQARLQLEKAFHREFWEHQCQTYLVPQTLKTYDSYLIGFLHEFLDYRRIDPLRRPNVYTMDGHECFTKPALWDLIRDRSWFGINTLLQQMDRAPVRGYYQPYRYNCITFTDVVYCVTDPAARWVHRPEVPPMPPHVGMDSGYSEEELALAREQQAQYYAAVDAGTLPLPPQPDYFPVAVDSYYVLSERFYKRQPGLSKLEWLVERMISNQEIDFAVLRELIELSPNWRRLERFYYYPLLLVLIQYAIQRVGA